jgi:hypothetical protein
MNKRSLVICGLLFLIGLTIVWWWLQPSPQVQTAATQSKPAVSMQPSSEDEQPKPVFAERPSEEILQRKIAEGKRAQEEQQQAFLNAFKTPINFWGKVVDEKGNPVPDAVVKLGTADRPWETGTSYERTTDANGLFSVTGANGLSISVNVFKEGYYQTPRSRGQLSYAQPSGNKEPLPKSDKPTVFELRKMGRAVDLLVKGISLPIGKNGAPIEINIETGKQVSAGQGDLKIEAWTNDQVKNAQGHYDWKARISVPGGGLIERVERFAFEAPPDGYQPFDEIVMPQTAERWNPQTLREYFVKLSDNYYARIKFEMMTGGDHFFTITSYLNPTPNARNLEYDPKAGQKAKSQ